MEGWILQFENAIKENEWEEAVQLLDNEKTKHAGTAPAQVKRKAIKRIHKMLASTDPEMYAFTTLLAKHRSPTAREVGAQVIPTLYPTKTDACTKLLHKLADDDHWEVREWAAGACADLLAEHYALFYPVLEEWKCDSSENVRRAVVLAVMYASKTLDRRYAHELLDLLEPLMNDGSPYVKKNLGAFAIGDALLKRYPQEVLPWLKRLAESGHEHVCWNCAMVFTSAASRQFHAEGEALLTKLESDERKSVQRAVKKGYRNLEKNG